MEIDDLKLAWQTLDRRLEQQHAMQLQLFRTDKLSGARSSLRVLLSGQVIQLLAGVLLMGLSGQFWIAHMASLHLLLYGLMLHVYGLMLAVFAVRDMVLIAGIDYAAPVLAIQKQLAELRAWRIRCGLWFAASGCFIWIPLTLVIFYSLGADFWLHKPQVVYWLVANGFVCLGLLYALLRWLRHPARTRIARHFDDDIAGRRIGKAQAVLDEIAQFEQL